MEVKLYNSLTNQKEVFKPIKENEVTCYVCGPTVYNFVHIGNMRPVVTFDILRRLFIRLGNKVTFISNFTDIDDKIIKQAKEEGVSEKEIAEKYIEAFEQDRENIHSLKPDYQPRVTNTMKDIVDFIDQLVQKGFAYEVNGDVYFRVNKIKDYGTLSNMKIDDLVVGARIDENSLKESPLDFTLWKKTEEGIKFDSPWSMGRPGWHSECVVMINKLVPGGHIDIHGGGFDLKFPHHENEIAQEEALHNHKIANYWMHNGFINVDNVKMSKSLGNVKRAVDLLKEYGGNTVRFVLINSYYRTPVNFSDELLLSAKKEVEKIEQTYLKLSIKLQLAGISLDSYDKELKSNEFIDALCDDLNTPNALTEMYKTLKEANVALRANPSDLELLTQLFFTLKDMIDLLGLKFDLVKLTAEDIALYEEYNLSKANKDFEKSDQLRKILIERKIF
ncbi:MAG: cysteine--tRNA ligase [Erysipelotrichaceae bacterium]|nr:cysteine--tRNA ligase [Erysipelotrichaceae bacterium]